MRSRLAIALVGAAFGATLFAAGFGDGDELRGMLLFRDPRLLLTFAGAIVLAAASFRFLEGRAPTDGRAVTRASVAGGVLFGIGWALSGACPAVALVQIAGGDFRALVSLGGIVAGIVACGRVRARWPWDGGSCGQ